MKSIGIVTDSHSGITQREADKLGIWVLPMPFYIEGKCYYEDVTLTREEFFQKLDNGAKITTSQPVPANVTELWDKALKEYEKILYIPISSGLSGSCSTAFSMAKEEPYSGRVLVVDNGRVSTPLHRCILDTLDLIAEGFSAEEIKEILEQSKNQLVIYVALQTLKHLKQGGRISPAAAAVGTVLNIKPVVKFDVGILDVYKKCRGFSKAKHAMLEAMKQDMEGRFQPFRDSGQLYLMAASSSSPDETAQWVREIQETFPGMDVMCDDLSLGLSCHIGHGGLGIGWCCKPTRQR